MVFKQLKCKDILKGDELRKHRRKLHDKIKYGSSKFKVPEEWHEASSIQRTNKYYTSLYKIESPWQLDTQDLCTPGTMYLVSDIAVDILGCRSMVSLYIRCTLLMIPAHVTIIFKRKAIECVIIMKIIVQEHELHVFQNFVYLFSAVQFLFCVLA